MVNARIKKGSSIFVNGKLSFESYTNEKTGVTSQSNKLTVTDWAFTPSYNPDRQNQQNGGGGATGHAANAVPHNAQTDGGADLEEDEDLPF